MYDAIEDPYTYKNSTFLVNKLDLRTQGELEAFEAEISSARAEEPLPEGMLDFAHYRAIHHHLFQDVYEVNPVPSEYQKAAIHFAFLRISKAKQRSYSTRCGRPTSSGILMLRRLRIGRRISSPN
jgi:hypothetical protein